MIGYPTWMLLLLIAISAALFDPGLSGNVIPMAILAPDPGAADKDRGDREPKADGKVLTKEGDGKDYAAASNLPTGSSNMPPSTAAGDGDISGKRNIRQLPPLGACLLPLLQRTSGEDTPVSSNMCGKTIQLDSESTTIELFGKLKNKLQFCPITVSIVSPVEKNETGKITFECEESSEDDFIKWSVFVNPYDKRDIEIAKLSYFDDEFASLRKEGPVTICQIYPPKKSGEQWRLYMRSCDKVVVLFQRFNKFKKSVNIPKCSVNFILE